MNQKHAKALRRAARAAASAPGAAAALYRGMRKGKIMTRTEADALAHAAADLRLKLPKH